MLHILPFTFHFHVAVCQPWRRWCVFGVKVGLSLPAQICDCQSAAPHLGFLHTLQHREEQQTLAHVMLCYFIVSGPLEFRGKGSSDTLAALHTLDCDFSVNCPFNGFSSNPQTSRFANFTSPLSLRSYSWLLLHELQETEDHRKHVPHPSQDADHPHTHTHTTGCARAKHIDTSIPCTVEKHPHVPTSHNAPQLTTIINLQGVLACSIRTLLCVCVHISLLYIHSCSGQT